MIENIILDWSGTLADDTAATLLATNDTLRHFGAAEVDMETYRRDFCLPVMGFYGPRLPGRTLAEIDPVFFDAYRRRTLEVPLFPGVVDFLRLQKSRGKRLFILSTMAQDILEAAAEKNDIAALFDRIIGGAADKGPVMSALLAEESLEPDRSLFVGDTQHDVEVGRAHGLRSGAALYGYGSEEQLRESHPDYAFADVAALGRMLDREHLFDTQKLVISTVGGVVRDPEGRILLVRTRKWSNTFGIPGGKIDYGETMLAAYHREMKEEVGLELENSRFVMIQDCIENPEFVKPRHFLLINYISDTETPEAVVTNYEIEESCWCWPAEAMEKNLNTPTRLVLEELARQGEIDLERRGS